MKAFVYKFKNLKERKEFIGLAKINDWIVSNYLVDYRLTVNQDSLNRLNSDGYISRFIVNGVLKVDEFNTIDSDEFYKYFVLDKEIEIEDLPKPRQISDEELMGAVTKEILLDNSLPTRSKFGEIKPASFGDVTKPLKKKDEGLNITGNLKIGNCQLAPLDQAIFNLVNTQGKLSQDMEIKISIKNGKVTFSVSK
ncbi:hypothetical protein [Aeromonas phage AS-zj]|uniref:Uncharacterized protein n=1 Tax=Aeromonas phage AS-zj TaxID=2024208 RepID=A0A223LDW2_9CAUD|nr:hypothetical protein HWB28_gp318 [Aeromonas phage AS-zj]ASU00234.1 hypothetical protein [Aeromonas phage AS-zj]